MILELTQLLDCNLLKILAIMYTTIDQFEKLEFGGNRFQILFPLSIAVCESVIIPASLSMAK